MGWLHACIFELLCEPSCILSSLPTALSKQSCWPPTRREVFAWHFHSQIICLSLKIYAMGCNRNSPEPEHLGLCCTAQLCSPGPAPAADTMASAPAPACGGLSVVDLWVCQIAAACNGDPRAWCGSRNPCWNTAFINVAAYLCPPWWHRGNMKLSGRDLYLDTEPSKRSRTLTGYPGCLTPCGQAYCAFPSLTIAKEHCLFSGSLETTFLVLSIGKTLHTTATSLGMALTSHIKHSAGNKAFVCIFPSPVPAPVNASSTFPEVTFTGAPSC